MATPDRTDRPLHAVPDFEPGLSATLPSPRTTLVGRHTDLERIDAEVLAGDGRLVTLTGPGGVGKTRLAIEVATGLVPHFAGAVLFVSIASVPTADLVIEAIARACGSDGGGTADPLEVAAADLGERPCLLVVDNLEHVPEAGETLATLLDRCPDLRILATSRRALRQARERVLPIEPLAVPDDHGPPLESCRDNDAVRLFTGIARSVDETFALTADNAGAVVELCRRLDGLPLALELAASRARVLAPRQLAALLGSRLDVLKRVRATGPDRQRTLWASIEASYDLLNPVDQRRFRRLGVFAGGFSAETVAAVTGDDIVDVVDTLAELDDVHLVRAVPAAGDARRFDLLETIRQFAVTKLEEAGETFDGRGRHARWCVALAAPAEAALTGPDPATTLDRLELEHDNVRAALAWLVANEPDLAMRLAADIWRFWWIRGHLREGRRWLDAAIGAATGDATLERADAEAARADLVSELGEREQATDDFTSASAIYEVLGHRRGVARCANGLANAARDRLAYDEAEGLHRRAIDLFQAEGDQRGTAMALGGRAAVAYYRGDKAGAEADWTRALAIARAIGDHRAAGPLLSNIGAARLDQGDTEGAIRAHEESAAIARQLGDRANLVQSLGNLGGALADAGDGARARLLLDEALGIARELGLARNEGVLLHTSAEVALRADDLTRAADDSARGLQLFVSTGMTGAAREALVQLAEIAERAGCRADHDVFARAGDDDLPVAVGRARAMAQTIASRPPTSAAVTAAARRAGLTPREADIANLLVQRATDAEIAAACYISVRTVTTHVSAILRKLGVSSRRAVATALANPSSGGAVYVSPSADT